ncbi:MAG: hypothetical protein KAR56_01460 [Thermoplasmata archaeon]|nr:hypothetical protein [Thermoplasmata archaeon]
MTIAERSNDRIIAGNGRYKVWLEKKVLDHGLSYTLGGGEKSHIGGLVYKELDAEAKVIKVQGHYDLEVLLPIAEAACLKYKQPVVVTGGIHIDNATKDEIDIIINNCKELLKCI